MGEARAFSKRRSGAALPLVRALALPALLATGWSLYVHWSGHAGALLVPLDRILAAPLLDADGRNLWLALAVSLGRLALGFATGASLGIAAELALGLSFAARLTVAPTLNAARQVTLFAWIPLLTAWFGNGEATKLVFIALSVFFPVALNTQMALRAIAVPHLEVSRVLRLSPRRRLTRVLLPGALPGIGLGLRIGLITAWLGTVTAEYAIGGGAGLGAFIAGGREQFRMDLVLAGVLALTLVGAATNALCDRALTFLTPYRIGRA